MNWYIVTFGVYRYDRIVGKGPLDKIQVMSFDEALLGETVESITRWYPRRDIDLARNQSGDLLLYVVMDNVRPVLSGNDYRLVARAVDEAAGVRKPDEHWRAYAKACPECSAEIGHHCVSPEGQVFDRGLYHEARLAP